MIWEELPGFVPPSVGGLPPVWVSEVLFRLDADFPAVPPGWLFEVWVCPPPALKGGAFLVFSWGHRWFTPGSPSWSPLPFGGVSLRAPGSRVGSMTIRRPGGFWRKGLILCETPSFRAKSREAMLLFRASQPDWFVVKFLCPATFGGCCPRRGLSIPCFARPTGVRVGLFRGCPKAVPSHCGYVRSSRKGG